MLHSHSSENISNDSFVATNIHLNAIGEEIILIYSKKFGPLDHEVAMTINMLLRDLTLKEFSWFDWRTKNKNNLRDLTLQEFSGLDQSLKNPEK